MAAPSARRRRRIDFAFYPFDPIGRRSKWHGLTVESFEDMTGNKLQAVLTRNQPRDFVDLYFMLREGPLRDLDALLKLVRAKFDTGPHPLGLAARLLLVHQIRVLPQMIRPLTIGELTRFSKNAHASLRVPNNRIGSWLVRCPGLQKHEARRHDKAVSIFGKFDGKQGRLEELAKPPEIDP